MSTDRYPVDKSDSVRDFNRADGRTKPVNRQPAPMRGGWRL